MGCSLPHLHTLISDLLLPVWFLLSWHYWTALFKAIDDILMSKLAVFSFLILCASLDISFMTPDFFFKILWVYSSQTGDMPRSKISYASISIFKKISKQGKVSFWKWLFPLVSVIAHALALLSSGRVLHSKIMAMDSLFLRNILSDDKIILVYL